MFNIFTKKITVPETNGTKEIETLQTWTVEWTSRYNQWQSGTKQEFEVFTSEKEALDFKLALQNAFKLIRHTSRTDVKITKN